MADRIEARIDVVTAARQTAGGPVHWMTCYDTDGDPYGELCWCTDSDGADHDEDGEVTQW